MTVLESNPSLPSLSELVGKPSRHNPLREGTGLSFQPKFRNRKGGQPNLCMHRETLSHLTQ